jgi:hypothetical protein
MRWERPGANDAATAKDQSDCRVTAEREAARSYPYTAGPPPYAAASADASWLMWQRNVDADRFAAEDRFMALCMRNKGYTRTPIN